MGLSKEQSLCVAKIGELFKTHDSVCLAWYTGGGKTEIFIEHCRRLIEKDPGARVGVSSYMTTEIKDQIYERFLQKGFGDKVFKISSNRKKDFSRNVTVFNPQGIFRSLPKKERFDLLILDEGHAGISHDKTMINRIIQKMLVRGGKILLVSATPWDALIRKMFGGIPVIKRSLEDGLRDGRISDFKIHKEQADIEFSPEDFTRTGDLSKVAARRRVAVLKATCIGKMKNLITRHGKDLGEKILVICPPGNSSEIARNMADEFGGLAFIEEDRKIAGQTKELTFESTKENLEKFKADPAVRFLFVTYKCSVGFDMKELSSIVDFTMTRNVRVLVQRIGRVARKNKGAKKKYFYVYDKSLGSEMVDWVLFTVIDFALGAYDGWTTKTAKYRPVVVRGYRGHKETIMLTEIIEALTEKNAMIAKETIHFKPPNQRPKFRTIEVATQEAMAYKNRHDLFKENPSLYKWFRINNALDTLNKIHPLMKKTSGRWDIECTIAAMKTCKSREEFNTKYEAAARFIRKNGRNDLKEKYLPPSRSAEKWSEKLIYQLLPKLNSWSDIRKHGNARKFLMRNGLEKKYQKIWQDKFNGKLYRTGRAAK